MGHLGCLSYDKHEWASQRLYDFNKKIKYVLLPGVTVKVQLSANHRTARAVLTLQLPGVTIFLF